MGKKPGSDAEEADLAPAGWMPANKAEIHMLPRYRRYTRSKRVQMALDVWQAREDDDLSLSQLARDFGVTRVALNRNWKQRLEEAGETYVPKYIGPNSEGLPPTARNPEYDAHKARLKSSAAMAKVGGKSLQIGNERRRVGDFWEFEKNYFGHIGCPDCDDKDGNPKRHTPPEFQRDMIAKSLNPDTRRLLVNMPPYHSKTTTLSVRRTLYQIVRDPNYRLLLVSQTAQFAEQIMSAIMEHFVNPDLYIGASRNLIDDWGPFKDPNRSWSASQIYVAGRTSAEKDPTIQCLGIGSQIYGRRADEIVFDDVVDTSRSKNPDQVQADLSWTDKMALSRIGKKGRAIWVGTRVAPGDLYSHLERRPSYEVVKYPAILDEAEGTVLWPDHFPLQQVLTQKDEMSSVDFQLVYQQLELPGAGAAFHEEMIDQCKDSERQWGHFEPGWHLVAGLDPAGANAWSGYTAMVLMGVDPVSEKRFLIDAVNVKQMKAPQILEQMIRWADEYPLAEWRVESNGIQALDVDTPILTDAGWSTMGNLKVGDKVAAPDGSWTEITAVSPVRDRSRVWEVEFSDKTTLVADAGHRWFVQPVSHGGRALEPRFMTTAEMVAAEPEFKYLRMANPEPLVGVEQELPVDPYVFGMWLGDGSKGMAQFTSDETNGDRSHLVLELHKAGYQCRIQSGRHRLGALRMLDDLRSTGAYKNKHIPDVYLQGSYDQRLALLQGLMDSDGTIAGEHGAAVFYNTNRDLVEGVEYLLRSLGFRPCPARWHTHDRETPIGVVKFYPNSDLPNPFRLPRKAELVQTRKNLRHKFLKIRSITPRDEPTSVRCITVAHESSQFLAGAELIPTGNSQLVQYNDDLNKKLVSRGTRVVPHFTHGNKWDPVFGVESMAPLFSHGMVSIPWASTQARAKFQPLVEQLLQFPMGSVSDLVMAMWFADLGLREKIQRQQLPLFNSRQKVPKRVARRRRVVDFNSGLVRGLTTEEQRPGGLSQTAAQVRRVTVGAPYDPANPPSVEPDEGPNFVNV